eukprot:m.106910 g.106910  ORF g.106910 m.106910 type:complete len:239 (-) comp27757_c0_seq2:145-861(-)
MSSTSVIMKKTVLITGAGSGFGKATAIELADRGHRVIAATETQEQANVLALSCANLAALKLDVTNEQDIAKVMALNPSVLINNASDVPIGGSIATIPVSRIRNGFNVNVFGMVDMMQAVIPGMKLRGGGRVINVSPVAGDAPFPLVAPYCMTKFAVDALTKCARAELAPFNIDVTCVSPGHYKTGLSEIMDKGDEMINDEASSALLDAMPQTFIMQVSNTLADLAEATSTPEATSINP